MTTIWVRWVNLDTLIRKQRKLHQVFTWDEPCVAGTKRKGGGGVGGEGGGEGEWEGKGEGEGEAEGRGKRKGNEHKGVLPAGVLYPLSPIPLPFSLPPNSLPLSTPATKAIWDETCFPNSLKQMKARGRISVRLDILGSNQGGKRFRGRVGWIWKILVRTFGNFQVTPPWALYTF